MPPAPDGDPPPPPEESDVQPDSEEEDDDDQEMEPPRSDDEDGFDGPPPLAEPDPREKKQETASTAKPVQEDPVKETPLSPTKEAARTVDKKATPQTKGKVSAKGPLPQVVRVVMTDSQAQFITLRCEPEMTVGEFSEVLAKKLSLKGKSSVINSSHFSLCLLDPRATRDPKKLQPSQNVIAAFKDQLLAAAGRYVLHLVPLQSAPAGVTKAIRASFAVSAGPSSGPKTPKKKQL